LKGDGKSIPEATIVGGGQKELMSAVTETPMEVWAATKTKARGGFVSQPEGLRGGK